MSESTKTILIVGGLAAAGFLAYRYITRKNTNATGGAASSGGTSIPSGNTDTHWYDNIGQWGSVIGGAAGSIDRTYNSLQNGLFPPPTSGNP